MLVLEQIIGNDIASLTTKHETDSTGVIVILEETHNSISCQLE